MFAKEVTVSEKIDKKLFSPSAFLYYTKPATQWEAELPVGNGRLGAMVYGKTGEEIIQLNEDTYWSGVANLLHVSVGSIKFQKRLVTLSHNFKCASRGYVYFSKKIATFIF